MGSLMNLTWLRQKQPRLKLNAEENAIIRYRILDRDGWQVNERPGGPSHEAQEPAR
jgi:hypothetical protein